MDERFYGPNHTAVATPLNNLATLLKDTNRLAEAAPLLRASSDERSYGPDNPDVVISNLADLCPTESRAGGVDRWANSCTKRMRL